MYVLILAGGSGTRLWPRSRQARPKQLVDLISERTMLQETYRRVRPIVDGERIFVVTSASYAHLVREQLPELPQGNVIGEPVGHNTAPCIGLGALYLRRLDPEGVMASLHADHVIEGEEEFRQILLAAGEAAREGHLVTLGIEPSYPETGLGYIKRGEEICKIQGRPVYRVERFVEKPDAATAKEFVMSGSYLWNSGIFLWRTATILGEIKRHLPGLHARLMVLERALGTADEQAELERIWAETEDISIDVGVMERAEDVVVIPADIGWSDVGNWATVASLLPQDSNGNAIVGQHIGLETSGNLIYSPKRLVVTIGVRDFIIVDMEDALLVCPRERAQDVRRLVDLLKQENRQELL